MISCLLIQVSSTPQGLPVRKESVVAGESIPIGRGAACKIHLPDHRVNLLHATLRRSEDGTLYIEGEKDVVISINGFMEQSAALSSGTRVVIGPYTLAVEPETDGHDIALSVEMTQPLTEHEAEKARQSAPTTLNALGLSKRKSGYAIAAGILLVFLFMPLLPGLSPALDKWQSSLPVTLTGSWSPGALSRGHAVFGSRCSTCHQHAFRAIADEVCEGCHTRLKKHMAKDGVHADALNSMRCTDCHADHMGEDALALHDQSRCVACHGDIGKKNPATALADVHTFDTDHPSFRIAVPNGDKVIRLRQDQNVKLVERSGIKFSHQIHLDKNGVSSPQGDVVMACRDCHKLDESGSHFTPITMQQTCQQSRCHALYFTEPVEGVVPHGSERVVMDRLRMFYVRWLSDSPVNMVACAHAGRAGTAAWRTLDCANDLAHKNAGATLFRSDLECGECHEIGGSADNEVPWKVAPVHINRDWQPGATFDHAKHDTMNCTECHDKINSQTSADIAMPTIEKCRECHAGERPAKDKVRSGCDNCHRFHGKEPGSR